MTSPQTSKQYIAWNSEPGERGTWSLLSSCVLTLVLCVYTAVHMNIPPLSQTKRAKWAHTAAWVSTGIFAPEIVVWNAWCQLTEAKYLTRQIQTLPRFYESASKEKVEAVKKLVKLWTLQHSFFVVMGGYQLDPAIAGDYLLAREKRLPKTILTTTSFLSLLRGGNIESFPVLTTKDINDRSKADNIAKLLSCLQGSWLAIQLLARRIANLAISELEVNTLAHVACAIGMYIFWLKKPLNIQQPVLVNPRGLEAWLFLHTGSGRHYHVGHGRIADFENQAMADRQTADVQDQVNVDSENADYESQVVPVRKAFHLRSEPASVQEHENMIELMSETDTSPRHEPKPHVTTVSRSQIEEQSQHDGSVLIRLFLSTTRSALRKVSASSDVVNISHEGHIRENWTTSFVLSEEELRNLKYYLETTDETEELEKRKWTLRAHSHMVTPTSLDSEESIQSISAISACYGGLHALLWNYHFPSITEMWMWRISSLVVASNGVIIASCQAADWAVRRFEEKMISRGHGRNSFALRLRRRLGQFLDSSILIVFITVLQAIQILCRVFLFVEAFISLRSQPASLYQVPKWSQWLPHL